MKSNVMHEITPLTPGDCFNVFSTTNPRFNAPLHYHEVFELKLLLNAGGAQRIVGSHTEQITDLELVLIGPNVCHTWLNNNYHNLAITETTVLFHKDLFGDKLLSRNQLTFVKNLIERSQSGILFSQDAIASVKDRIVALDKKKWF